MATVRNLKFISNRVNVDVVCNLILHPSHNTVMMMTIMMIIIIRIITIIHLQI